ncbi:LysE family translocator [Octadecabacter sp. G9-8]|uniref:LysE family translocator n=1 Tax=Octadecabacter dasysiphoniae TaxID=2909341 RepID=A0ABS9CXR7_9RHOB|nr:LysE family translocator [Octadecabacter dasysiphoniae]MCF2872061.1 LysE family translocator [Octadecabacter dasysiphoniae]
MPPLENIIAVVIAGTLLSITPGPSMLYVLSRSIGQSRGAGLASVIGLALGGMILAVATALGLAKLFVDMPSIVIALRYCGSAYLVWLGVKMILNARADAMTDLTVETVAARSYSSIVWQGVLVEMLNPKTVLFFALFLPPFVDLQGTGYASGSVQSQLLVLGLLVPLTAVPSDGVIAVMGGTLTQSLRHRRKFRERLGWIGGLILIVIAANLHFSLL